MTGYMDEVGYVDMKEYWYHANRLRKRIDRKIHEIHMLRQRAEGMNGCGNDNMPKTASPDPHKIDGTVFKIIALEKEIQESQNEYDSLIYVMEQCINKVEDDDARDLLQKRYLEFLPWTEIMTEMGYSRSHVFRLHNKAVEAIKSWDLMGLENT